MELLLQWERSRWCLELRLVLRSAPQQGATATQEFLSLDSQAGREVGRQASIPSLLGRIREGQKDLP